MMVMHQFQMDTGDKEGRDIVEENPDSSFEGLANWLTGVTEGGGITQLVLGKHTSQAIGQLISGLTAIPAAALHSVAQRINDTTDARHQVRMTLAAAAAKAVKQNKDLIEDEVWKRTGKTPGRLANRVAVAAKALEDLADQPPSKPPIEGPTADFMNVFEDLAEKASSDNLQDLFARILAGEIRQPGSFSLRTLHIISVMDQKLASAARQVAEWVIGFDYIPMVAPLISSEKFDLIGEMADLAVVRLLGIGRDITLNAEGFFGLRFYNTAIVIRGTPHQKVAFPIAPLTPVGKEVMSLILRSGDEPTLRQIASGISSLHPMLRVGIAPITSSKERDFNIGEVSDILS